MKWSKLVILIFVCFYFSSFSQEGNAAKNTGLEMSSNNALELLSPLKEAVELKQIGSAVGLVAQNGKIIFLESTGQLGDNIAMPTNAIVRTASIGKIVTAAAVMILYERGQIQLSDNVHEYLPEYAGIKVKTVNTENEPELVSPKVPITIHHLLTHQSGIASRGNEFWNVWDKAKTTREFSLMISKLNLEFQPGEQFNYGQMGSSYELLAAIVEIISGKNFKDFVTDEILKPLKMNDTFFWVPESRRNLLAASYMIDKDGNLVVNNKMGEESPPHNFWAGGGSLRSTVYDFFRFTQCLLNQGELEGVRILKPKTVQMMVSNKVARGAFSDQLGWGYGTSVRIRASPSRPGNVGTYGWNGGTGTMYVVDPIKKMIVIIFIPSRPRTPEVSRLRNQFIDMAYSSMEEINKRK